MIDYYQIQSDLHGIISAGTYSDVIKEFMIEGMERDMLLANMPFINIRQIGAEIEIRSLPNGYYGKVFFEVDVVTVDLSEFRKAAIVRDRILKEVQTVIQGNRQFSAGVETSVVGPRVVLGSGTEDGDQLQSGHIAFATFDVSVEVFIEPT